MKNRAHDDAQVQICKGYKRGNSNKMRMISEVMGMGRESFEILIPILQAYVICISSIVFHNNFDSYKFYFMKYVLKSEGRFYIYIYIYRSCHESAMYRSFIMYRRNRSKFNLGPR